MSERPILCVVGARPNFMKMAPLLRALRARTDLPPSVLLHTGQHYDERLKDRVFEDLRLPEPDIDLQVGSGTHAVQTAEVMTNFEPVLDRLQPSCVVVVGDVNSTFACSLVAVKKQIPIAHVEAGLRSFDRAMPEEINRVLTDQIADLLYTTERTAEHNLLREGVAAERIQFVGNLMIDSLLEALPRAKLPNDLQLPESGFALVTLHRPSNVDEADRLEHMLGSIGEVSKRLPIVWAMHPRTAANLERFGLRIPEQNNRIRVIPAQGYLAMVALMRSARMVLTDSGGVQEETTALGVPCLTLRSNTERPITIGEGTNTLVGTDRELLLSEVDEIVVSGGKRGRVPEYWDGRAAERIANHLASWLASGAAHGGIGKAGLDGREQTLRVA
jgi:UDP-N-acetylglucosamine 2-epimerase (non-hydrolysing)